MARILVIGGTTFMGYQLVWRLLAAGHAVTILNRGLTPDPFGDRVSRLRVDRQSQDFGQLLASKTFDAAVDFAAFTAKDVKGAVEALQGRIGHYVFISSGAAYLARAGAPIPVETAFSESEYSGPTRPRPEDPEDIPSWRYAADKRAAEAVLEDAWARHRFPSTRIRLPNVNGVRDPERRVESYVCRILDGGPVLLPYGGHIRIRHVFVNDVVKTIESLIGKRETFGQAYNLSQDEEPTMLEFVGVLADLLGAPNRSMPISADALQRAGLRARDVSPFSGRWASRIDPSRAKAELGFQHQPLAQYLGTIISAILDYPNPEPPPGYENRAVERGLAKP
jgi:nucleoside-diphosphate-sugar epimerase